MSSNVKVALDQTQHISPGSSGREGRGGEGKMRDLGNEVRFRFVPSNVGFSVLVVIAVSGFYVSLLIFGFCQKC